MTEPQSPPAEDPLIMAFYGDRPRYRGFDPQAALLPFWFAWRKMVLLQVGVLLVFVFFWVLLGVSIAPGAILSLLGTAIIIGVIAGASAPSLLAARARAAHKSVIARGLTGDEALEAMRRAGKPSLLAFGLFIPVGAFLGINMISGLSHTHDHTAMYRAAMRSDLRNLVTAQEAYFADSIAYYRGPIDSMPGFFTSTGVTLHLGEAGAQGWSATATHTGEARFTCAMYVGTVKAPFEDMEEGVPKCERTNNRRHQGH